MKRSSTTSFISMTRPTEKRKNRCQANEINLKLLVNDPLTIFQQDSFLNMVFHGRDFRKGILVIKDGPLVLDFVIDFVQLVNEFLLRMAALKVYG